MQIKYSSNDFREVIFSEWYKNLVIFAEVEIVQNHAVAPIENFV